MNVNVQEAQRITEEANRLAGEKQKAADEALYQKTLSELPARIKACAAEGQHSLEAIMIPYNGWRQNLISCHWGIRPKDLMDIYRRVFEHCQSQGLKTWIRAPYYTISAAVMVSW